MARTILTLEEIASAIRVDPDYPQQELQLLADAATSFINQKTGRDWTSDEKIHALAKMCASLYAKQIHYGADGYNKEHDYTLGINGLIEDLKDIARGR